MRSWKTSLTLIAATIVAVLGLGSVAAAPSSPRTTQLGRAITYTFPANTPVFPEGIAYHVPTGNFFVGSTTDGTIYRGNIRADNHALVPFLPGGQDGRTTAVGMKVASNGFLWIAGGGTGRIWLYDSVSGRNLLNIATGTENTFINDVALAPDESAAYFTDSVSPFIYRVALDAQGQWQYELWRDLTDTAFVYGPGFNANGIVTTPDGRYLIIVQSSTGKLFRIATATKEVTEINTGGQTVMAGDGMLLVQQTLYVMRNQAGLLVRVQMSADYARGSVTGQFTNRAFAYPTTFASAGQRLLVVNSQFDKRGPNLTPTFPFTIASVPAPR